MNLDELRAHDKPLVSVRDAADALGLPRSSLYEAVRYGRFPVEAIQVGRRTYLSRAALLRLIDGADPQEGSDTASSASGG